MAHIGRDDGHQDLRGSRTVGPGRGAWSRAVLPGGAWPGAQVATRSRPLGFKGGPCLHGGVEGFSPVCGAVWVTNTPTLQEDAGGGGC